MGAANNPEPTRLTSTTSGFALAALTTVLFSTGLACAKDAYAPLKAFMRSLTGHDWTTQGLADLLLFAGLGFIFASTGAAEKMDPKRLIGALVVAAAMAALGLALWYAFF